MERGQPRACPPSPSCPALGPNVGGHLPASSPKCPPRAPSLLLTADKQAGKSSFQNPPRPVEDRPALSAPGLLQSLPERTPQPQVFPTVPQYLAAKLLMLGPCTSSCCLTQAPDLLRPTSELCPHPTSALPPAGSRSSGKGSASPSCTGAVATVQALWAPDPGPTGSPWLRVRGTKLRKGPREVGVPRVIPPTKGPSTSAPAHGQRGSPVRG